MAQVFTISDGTTTIDLLDPDGYYHLSSYETGLNPWKEGGIFTDSQLSEGSVPVFRQFDTFEEKVGIHIVGTTQDEVIDRLRSLLELFENGVKFFLDGFTGAQVYMAVKGDTETNTRYGVITSYAIESLPGQFTGPIVTGGNRTNTTFSSIYNDIEIVLKRGLWLESPPGTEIRAYLDSTSTFNSVNFGVSSSNTIGVVATNYRATANITHVFRYDDSAATYSSNLLAASLPYELWPNPAGANDILYIGSSSAVTNSGPFFNIVFNIGTITTDDLNIGGAPNQIRPMFWTGAVWEFANDWNDETNAMQTAGQGVSSWSTPTTWTTTTVNGVAGYWIRYNVTSVTGTPPIPTQATRHVYTANNPYIEVQSTNLSGDVDSLTKLEIVKSGTGSINKIILGKRLYSRGSSFISHINFADEQNPSGITVGVNGGVGVGYITDPISPTGRALSMTATASEDTQVYVLLDSTIASSFNGKFRAFLRMKHTAGEGVLWNKLTISSTPIVQMSGGNLTQGQVVYPVVENNGDSTTEVIDFGIIELPAAFSKTEDVYDIIMYFNIYDTTASLAITISLYDLILIPADEQIIEVDSLADFGDVTIIDKVSSPEEPLDIKLNRADALINKPVYGGTDGISLSAGERQRIYMFSYFRAQGDLAEYNADFDRSAWHSHVYKLNRYLLPRGTS